jgi:hypothetical protein
MKLRLLALGFGLLAAAAPVLAHHAFSAEFDANQPITIKGKVTKISWTNPHVWIYVNVQDEAGKLTNWGFEMGAPHQVQGRGWSRTTVKIGDDLVVVGSRARDGSNRMNARNVTWAATGKTLGAASSETTTTEAPAVP